MMLSEIDDAAREFGLRVLGDFAVQAGDDAPRVGAQPAAHLALVGNAGSEMWAAFSRAREFGDARAAPLDRWSERVGGELARRFSARAVFPFGDARHPFLRWGKRAGLENSALGMLIHPRFGLWHAYRFALVFARANFVAAPAERPRRGVCANCEAKPCLRACPAAAFSARGYDAHACREYLRASPKSRCMREGCIARHACPHAEFRYAPAHAAFHMRAFLDSERE